VKGDVLLAILLAAGIVAGLVMVILLITGCPVDPEPCDADGGACCSSPYGPELCEVP